MTSLRLIIADMLRRSGWLAVLVTIVFVASAASTFSLAASAGLSGALKTGIGRAGADLAVIPKGQSAAFRRILVTGEPVAMSFADPTDEVRAFDGVDQASAQLFVASAQADCCSAGDVLIIATNPQDDFVVKPWIERGVLPQGDSAVATGVNLKRDLGMPIAFYGVQLSVDGRLAKTGWGYFDNAAFVTRQAVVRMAQESRVDSAVVQLRITPDTASVVWVKTDEDPETVAQRIRSGVSGADVMVLSALLPGMRDSMVALGRGLTFFAAAVAVFAITAVTLAFSLAVSRRTQDLAVLSAAGVSRRGLCVAVLVQAGVIGLVGGLLGGWSGAVVARAFAQWMALYANLPLLPPSGLQVGLAGLGAGSVASLACALTAAGPALSASMRGVSRARR